jgi:WD40 repeat protein
MAVGLSTGKVDLIRLEAAKQAQRKNVLSSGPSVTLPIRNARSCNVVTFNNVDPNYLAVGLDKVRGDASLMIWDISTVAPSLALPLANPNDTVVVTPPKPRPQPLLPRFETQTRLDSRVIQQHAPAEVVSSLAFLPSSTNLILAGISHRWLRLFDLRSAVTPTVNVATKVNGIVTDPFDPHRIATFGDATVTIWDARRFNHPILTFSERDAIADGARIKPGALYANVEFSSTRRGCIATLEKDSSYVRFWDLAESKASTVEGSVTGGGSSDGETSRSRDSVRVTKRSWAANLPWPAGGSQQTPSPRETLDSSTQRSFVIADTRRSKQ